jgi:phage replication O-like protein O
MGIEANTEINVAYMSDYTALNNQLLEQMMKTKFATAQNQVFLAILRKTVGWNKEMDKVSYDQISELTGIDRRRISTPLKGLIDRMIIVKIRGKFTA